MPFLYLSNPRNRATVIALLLVIEFLAILWLRDPGLGQGGSRRRAAAIFSPGSSHDRSHVQDDLQHRQNLQHQQQKEHPRMVHEDFLKLRKVERDNSVKKSTLSKESDSKEGQSSDRAVPKQPELVSQQLLQDRHYRQRHHHHHRPAGVAEQLGTVKEQQIQKQLVEGQIRSGVEGHGPVAAAVKATLKATGSKAEEATIELDLALDQTPSTLPDPKEDKIVKDIPRVPNDKGGSPAKSNHANKKNKGANTKAAPKSKSSSKQSQQSQRQQQGKRKDKNTFKSTEERKRSQLIPALDESGTIIEDHFISPRDTDGDGIPDTFILLRPSGNSKYMMDVGLFDDEVAMVPPPKGTSTPSISIALPASTPSTQSSTTGPAPISDTGTVNTNSPSSITQGSLPSSGTQ